MSRSVLVSFLALLGGSSVALAQPAAARPTRADFENAVLDRAAAEIPAHRWEENDRDVPLRRLSREERVQMLGRVVPLPDGRTAAIVRFANGRWDANEDLAYGFALVVLGARNDGRAAIAAIEVPSAPFTYEEPIVSIARSEDVDDDGENELFVVMNTNTQVEGGTGHCSVRRTVVIDAGPTPSVTANVAGQVTCESEGGDERRGTTQFRDTNGDGHRDLVLRVRECPGVHVTPEGEIVTPPCGDARETIYTWQAATDRYTSM